MIKRITLSIFILFNVLNYIFADPSKGKWKQFIYTDGLSSNYIFDVKKDNNVINNELSKLLLGVLYNKTSKNTYDLEIQSKKSNNMEVVMKFTYLNEKVLTNIDKDDYQLKNKHVEAKFYSELNAINFAIKNYENIDIISPQFLINELKNRNDKLKKKLKI